MFKFLVATVLVCAGFQDGKMVDNPEFQGWKKCKVGSWVKMKVTTEASGIKSDTTVTTKLLEVKDDKVVVEIKVATPESTTKQDIPAKVKEGMMSDGGTFKQTGKGEEEIEVAGKKIKCKWIEGDVEKTAHGMTLTGKGKIWMNDDTVGGTVKFVMTADMAGIKMTQTITYEDSKRE